MNKLYCNKLVSSYEGTHPNSALKSLKKCKACGVDGLAVEILFMLTVLLMYFYLCYSIDAFIVVVYPLP